MHRCTGRLCPSIPDVLSLLRAVCWCKANTTMVQRSVATDTRLVPVSALMLAAEPWSSPSVPSRPCPLAMVLPVHVAARFVRGGKKMHRGSDRLTGAYMRKCTTSMISKGRRAPPKALSSRCATKRCAESVCVRPWPKHLTWRSKRTGQAAPTTANKASRVPSRLPGRRRSADRPTTGLMDGWMSCLQKPPGERRGTGRRPPDR